jgi:hypothetical protein
MFTASYGTGTPLFQISRVEMHGSGNCDPLTSATRTTVLLFLGWSAGRSLSFS